MGIYYCAQKAVLKIRWTNNIFTYLSNKYFLSSYYVPAIVLGTGEIIVDKTNKIVPKEA